MRKIALLGMLLAFVPARNFAQEATAIPQINQTNWVVTPTAPEAAKFQLFTEMPVNFSNGTVNVSIPLYQIQLKGFTWDISITYDTRGNKVGDIASSVGLGWLLNYGGMVSMRIIGGSDLTVGNEANQLLRELDLYSYGSLTYPECTYSSTSDVLTAELNTSAPYSHDLTPDLFFVNTNTINTKFFMDIGGEFRTMPASQIKIATTIAADTISKWTVTDAEGNRYTFAAKASSTQFYGSCGSTISGEPSDVYYLTKIVTFKNEEINFHYSTVSYSYASVNKETKYAYPTYQTYDPCYNFNSGPQGEGSPADLNCSVTNYVTEKLIDSVSFPGGVVVFTNSTRSDVSSAKKLDKVAVYSIDNSTRTKTQEILMINSYFGSGSNPDDLRLKLSEVRFKSTSDDDSAVYSFTYNSQSLPNRLSKSLDSAGYYNGATNATLILPTADRASSLTYTKACALEKITYPSGGTSQFSYELNPITKGLRIHKIESCDSVSSTPLIKRYEYSADEGGAYQFSKTYQRFYVYKPSSNGQETQLIQCDITEKSSEPIQSYQYYESSILYDKVIEYLSNGNNQGKTEYFYSQPAGLEQFDYTGAGFPLSKQTVYKYNASTSQFDTVQQTSYEYKVIKNDSVGFYANSPNPLEHRTYGINLTFLHDEFSFQGDDFTYGYCHPKSFLQARFRLISAPLVLLKRVEKIYNGSQVLVKTLDYSYGSNFDHVNPIKLTTYTSDGSSEDMFLFYPDYLPNLTSYSLPQAEISAYDSLVARNMLSAVIFESQVGSSVIGKKLVSYKFQNSLLLPYRERIYNSGTDISFETLMHAYDAKGNVTQMSTTEGGTTSYLWDYGGKYLSAAVRNAGASPFAITSFESDGKGNWTFSGNSVTDATSPTGSKCYYLPNGNLSISNLVSADSYIVSYWSKSGSYTVSGSSSLKQGKTISGWTYYEHTVTGQTTVTLSGSGYIDEVRLHPPSALVTSFTHDPLRGMTSSCDPNNRITYYEHDGLGRLKVVRDQDKNVMKRYAYKYRAGLSD